MRSLLLLGVLAGPISFIAGATLLIGFLTPDGSVTVSAALGGLALILGGVAAFGLALAESMHGATKRLD